MVEANQRNSLAALFSGPEHLPFHFLPSGDGSCEGALLIHGFPGTPAEMRPLGRKLAAEGWAAHGILLPGFGHNINRLPDLGVADWLEGGGEVWDEVRHRYRPALLIGYSMGASVALRLAASRPPDYLVLLAPFWTLDDWRFQLVAVLKYLFPQVTPFARADFQDPEIRRAVQRLLPNLNLADPKIQDMLRNEISVRTGLVDDIRLLGQEAFRQAGRLQMPTLVIQGQRDEIVRPSTTRRLVRQLGGPVTYHEIAAAHDFPQRGEDSSYAQLVLDFLERGGQ